MICFTSLYCIIYWIFITLYTISSIVYLFTFLYSIYIMCCNYPEENNGRTLNLYIYTVVLFTCVNYIIIIYTIFIVKLYSRLPVRTGRPSVCSFSLISTSLVFIVIYCKTITKNYCSPRCLLNVF